MIMQIGSSGEARHKGHNLLRDGLNWIITARKTSGLYIHKYMKTSINRTFCQGHTFPFNKIISKNIYK